MNETSKDLLNYDDEGKPIMPGGINVLTILTIIWCSISAILILCTPMINKWLLGAMDKAATSGQEISAKTFSRYGKIESCYRIG
ncbi:MAG: hypothetical protein WDM90_13450 [Ferruginibacter sp.]